MAHRLTKEELDQQFEQFMKESVSDDSIDLGSSTKHPSVLDSLGKAPVRPGKKASVSVPWWQDDDDSEEGTEKNTKRRFAKIQKSQAVDSLVGSRHRESPPLVPIKPTPKPRSKAFDRVSQQSSQRASHHTSHQKNPEYDAIDEKMPSPEHSYCLEEQRVSEEDSCCVPSPVPYNSPSTSGQKSPIHTDSEFSVESNASDSIKREDGMSSTGRSFLKSLRKTSSIKEVDEEQPKELFSEDEGNRDLVVFSRDSLEPEVPSAGALRVDMLDEDDNTRFLSNLKKESSSIDYYRLNQDQEPSTPTSPQRRKEMNSTNEEEQGENKDTAASPAYSEDFEEEASEKSDEGLQEKKPERHGMLAKVSLHDSLNSTDGALLPAVPSLAAEKEKCPEPAVQSYGQSGGSEMEALQEAYRQISSSAGECEDGRAEGGRTPLSLSSLHPVSTVESDLPTAEELMRPIGPDSGFTRGFALQPISEAVPQGSKNHSPLRRSSDESPFSSANEGCGGGNKTSLTGGEHPASLQYTQKSITEEIKRLMQEQDASSVEPPPVKPKKRQVPARNNAFASASSRKTPVPSTRVKKPESRLLPRGPAPSRTGQAAKPPSPLTQRKAQNQTPKKTHNLSQTQAVKGLDTSLRLSSELVTSVQSFATFLQHQVEASSLQDNGPLRVDRITPETLTGCGVMQENMDGGIPFQQERTSLERFRLQLAQKERELHLRENQLREEHKQELAALRQENYVLQSKLHRAEEAGNKRKWSFGEASDPVTEEKLKLIEKEIKEQETLIQCYHQENEKLYLQMKALQAQSKQNEEALFMENQRLLTELALTRDRLNMNSIQRTVGGRSIADQGFSIAELTSQVQAAQKREERLQDEIHRLKQEKQALHVDLEMMRKERDLARVQAVCTSGDKGFELKMLQEKHREEVAEMKKRLQWYAENQELLDKDASRLRAATAETQRLTEQVEKLKMEVSRRTNEQQRKTKERAGEAKRIQDLERQLKQMEELLKRRHPNSLPALILAAASADVEVDGSDVHPSTVPQSSQTAALLERRVHRLEAELEGHDEAAKRSLRAMEQQYHRIKLQYEQQITDLEQRLADNNQNNQAFSSELSESQTQRLKAELDEVKMAHQKKESTLQAEVASLQEQLRQAQAQALTQTDKPARSPSRHQLNAEAAQATRIERLTQELSSKSRTIQELSRTVERLQRERKTMLSGPGFDRDEPKRHLGAAKEPKKPAAETFPPTQDEKDYHPGAFSGSHISEVQLENDSLRMRLAQLEIQGDQEKVSLQAAVTHAQTQLLRVQEQNAEQLTSVKAEHQKEIERLLACHALEHSSSKVAELSNQVNTQEIIVQHLQGQVKELQGTKDALAVSKIREETLQNQLSKLLEELKQAKEAHSPELRHFTSLEQKIQSMELRYNQREKQLQQVIADTRRVVEQEQQGEVERWRRLAHSRAKELDAFRLELDSILDVLRELQRQGVVIPAPEHTSSTTHTYLPLRS